MSTRQLVMLVVAVTVLAAGLGWWMQRFELTKLHEEIAGYLQKIDAFKAWEAGEHGGQ